MVSKKVTVKNPTGLHLRPAGILCNEAMKYQSQITFVYDGGMANAKSVLSVLGACVKCGNEIELTCEGVDEQEPWIILLLLLIAALASRKLLCTNRVNSNHKVT